MNAAHFPGGNDWSSEGANCNPESDHTSNDAGWSGAQANVRQEQWSGGGMCHQPEPPTLDAAHSEHMTMQHNMPDSSREMNSQPGCYFEMQADFSLRSGVHGFSPEWDSYLRSVFAVVEQKAQEQKQGLAPDLRPMQPGSPAHSGSSNNNNVLRGLPSRHSKGSHLVRSIPSAKERSALPTASPSGGTKRSFPDDSPNQSKSSVRPHPAQSNNYGGEDESDSEGSQEDEAESEPERRCIDPRDGVKLREYYEECLRHIQQTQCRRVGQDWVKAVHPKKQAKYPYSNSKAKDSKIATKAPPWWPEGVKHMEPAHIKIEPRMTLLLHIICNTRGLEGTGNIDEFGVERSVTVKYLRKATDANPKIMEDKRAQTWLNHIYDARERAEQAEDGGYKSAQIDVPWPPKRRSRRGNNTQRRKTEDTRANEDDASGSSRLWAKAENRAVNRVEDEHATINERQAIIQGDEDDSSESDGWVGSDNEGGDPAGSRSYTDTTSTSTSPSVRVERAAGTDYLVTRKISQAGFQNDRTHPELHVNTRLRGHQNNPSGLRNEEPVKVESEQWGQPALSLPGRVPGPQAHTSAASSPMHSFHGSHHAHASNSSVPTPQDHGAWLQHDIQTPGSSYRAPQRQNSLQVSGRIHAMPTMEQPEPEMMATYSQASSMTHTPALGAHYNENQIAHQPWPQTIDGSMFAMTQPPLQATQAGHWPKPSTEMDMVTQSFSQIPQIGPTTFMGQSQPMSPNTTEMNQSFATFNFATPDLITSPQQGQVQQQHQKHQHGQHLQAQHPHQQLQHIQQQQPSQMIYAMHGGHMNQRPHAQQGF